MIILFPVLIVIYALLAIAALIYAKKKNTLFILDFLQPIIVIGVWILITSLGIGHQSLSHIIEIPILLVISLVTLYIRVFLIDRYSKNYKKNSFLVLGAMVLIIILLRMFMPYLPE